jgi:hypothetical protein
LTGCLYSTVRCSRDVAVEVSDCARFNEMCHQVLFVPLDDAQDTACGGDEVRECRTAVVA